MKKLILWCVLYLSLADGKLNYYWRDYTGAIPQDAVSVSANIYVAQALTSSAILPGVVYSNQNYAVTQFGTRMVATKGIKILCDSRGKDNFYWEEVHADQVVGTKLDDLVVGGIEGGYTLYIGKVYHEDNWKVSKVFTADTIYKGLHTWFNNKTGQHTTHTFQILKYQETQTESCNGDNLIVNLQVYGRKP